jgi:uncharacterized protein (UPF0335 family)
MGFNFGAFLGGGAKAIKEEADQEREDVKELFNTSAKLWTEMGITALQTNRAKRKELRNIAESLQKIKSPNGQFFNTDQIATVLKQGQGDSVLKSLREYADNKIEWSPNDIVDMGENFEVSNKTIDEILNDVLGEVKKGTPYSDALIKSQPATLSEKLGLFSSSDYIKKRVETFGAVLGKDLSELQALAFDDRTSPNVPMGNISLVNRSTIGGATRNQFSNSLLEQIFLEYDVEYDVRSGVTVAQDTKKEKTKNAMKLHSQMMKYYDDTLQENKETKGDIQFNITDSITNKDSKLRDTFFPKAKDDTEGGTGIELSFGQQLDKLLEDPDFGQMSETAKIDKIFSFANASIPALESKKRMMARGQLRKFLIEKLEMTEEEAKRYISEYLNIVSSNQGQGNVRGGSQRKKRDNQNTDDLLSTEINEDVEFGTELKRRKSFR